MSEMHAQVILSGKIVDQQGSAIDKASVILKDQNGHTLAFGSSNKQGLFSVQQPEGRHVKTIVVNHMSYQKKDIPINEFSNGQTIKLDERTEKLKEVLVKPDPIRRNGDTLTYVVSSFMQKQDKYLEDVIARLPGVEVSPSGKILYQGQEINKFYVEGLDLMGNAYNQVSRNLRADNVKNIQVYEQHQPIKMKRGISFSEQAAMNIQLKDELKGAWTGIIEAGLGVTLEGHTDVLRDDRLVGMQFGRKRQTLGMFKTNNTGKNVASEVGYLRRDPAGILRNLVSPIGGNTSFNDSHIVAFNNLIAGKKDDTWRLNVTGLLDKSTLQTYSESRYFDIDGQQTVIMEEQDKTGRTNQWDLSLQYQKNHEKFFIQNLLKGYVDFNKGYGTSILNDKETPLNVRPRHRFLENLLKINRKLKNNHIIEFSIEGKYHYLPGTLLLYDGNEEMLDMEYYSLLLHTSFSQNLGKGWRMNYHVGADVLKELMDVEYGNYNGHDSYTQRHLSVYPELSYMNKKLSVSMNLRANYLYRTIADDNDSRFYVDPRLALNYRFNDYFRFSGGYNYSYLACGSVQDLTRISYYSVYNHVRQGQGSLTYSTSHQTKTALSYNNELKRFFANVSLTGTFRKSLLFGGSYDQGIYIQRSTDIFQHTRNYSVSGIIQKNFSFWMSSFTLRGGSSLFKFHTLRGGKPMPFENKSENLMVELKGSPITLVSVELMSHIMWSHQDKNLVSRDLSSFRNYQHSASLYFLPGRWQINCKLSYNHSNDPSQKNSFVGDAYAMYRRKAYDIGLYLNNIFGQRERQTRTITETGEFYNISYLRSREILVKVGFNL